MYKCIGKADGLHVVRFDGGREERLTDEEYAALQGGRAVVELKDRKKSESLAKRVAELETELADKDAELAKAVLAADASAKAAQEWRERCEKAESDLESANGKILSLEAANKALEQAAGGSTGAAAETPGVPTSAKSDDGEPLTMDEALKARVDGYGWDKLKAVCAVLGIEPAESKPDTIAAIKAERARRDGGGE